jgi:heme exporter protein A
VLEGRELACVRGERTLFTHVSFELEKGALLRVIGSNGSGKTSLLRILCGLTLPAEGEVRWEGQNIRTLREEYWKDLAYVGHINALKDDLTASENLQIGSTLNGRDVSRGAAIAALTELGVGGCAHLPARVLSQGQRRRVALARLLVSRSAPLWVLDEPLTALDVRAVAFIENLISEQLAAGGTVILTTHQQAKIAAAREQQLDLDALDRLPAQGPG